MNNLNNINTLQNLTDVTYLTSYTNEYLISALANLGQRSNIKDNYIVYETLKLENIITDSYGEGVYCMKIEDFGKSAGMSNLGIKYVHIDSKDKYSINDIISNLQTQAKTLFTNINFIKKNDYTLYNSINNINSYDVYFMQDNNILNIYYIGYSGTTETEYAFYKLDISEKSTENSTYKIIEGLIYYNLAIYTTPEYKSYWTRIYFQNIDNMVIPGFSENSVNNKSILNEIIDDDTESKKQYYIYCVDSDYYNQDKIEENTEGLAPNEYVVKHYLKKDKSQYFLENTCTFLQVIQSIINGDNEFLKEYNPDIEISIKNIILNRIINDKFLPICPVINNGVYINRYTVSAFYIDEINTNLTELIYTNFTDIDEVNNIEGIIQKEYLHLLNQLTDTYFNSKFSSSTEVQKYIIYKLIEKSLDGLDSNSFVILNKDFSIKYIHDKNNLLYIYSLLNYFHGEFFSLESNKELFDYGQYSNYLNYFYCWNPITTLSNVSRLNENKIVVYNLEVNSTNTNYDSIIHGFEVNEVYTLPYIDSNGEWVINNKLTNYSSVGEDSGNPNMFYIIQENTWEDISSEIPSYQTATAYFNEELSQYFNNSNKLYSVISQKEDNIDNSFILPSKDNIKYYEKISNYLSCTHIIRNSYNNSNTDSNIPNNYIMTFWNYNTNQNNDDKSGTKDELWKPINDSQGNILQLTLLSSLTDYISSAFSSTLDSNDNTNNIIKECANIAVLNYIQNDEDIKSLLKSQISYFWKNDETIINNVRNYFTETDTYKKYISDEVNTKTIKLINTYIISGRELSELKLDGNNTVYSKIYDWCNNIHDQYELLHNMCTQINYRAVSSEAKVNKLESIFENIENDIEIKINSVDFDITETKEKVKEIDDSLDTSLSIYTTYKNSIDGKINDILDKINILFSKIETVNNSIYSIDNRLKQIEDKINDTNESKEAEI